MIKPVAVLGCGPSGLLAVHTCRQNGIPAFAFSKGAEKSVIYGAQYLIKPVGGVTFSQSMISHKLRPSATMQEYLAKTHGEYLSHDQIKQEFQHFDISEHAGWDIRKAYKRLWYLYGSYVRPLNLVVPVKRGHAIDSFLNHIDVSQFSLVISTVPRKLWRQPGDEFVYSQGWATSGTLADTITLGFPNNHVAYDGSGDVHWNRASRIFGFSTVEWPWNNGNLPPYGNEESRAQIAKIVKPLRHKVSCQNGEALIDGGPPWVFAGRYGAWEKKYFATDVIDITTRALRLNGAI